MRYWKRGLRKGRKWRSRDIGRRLEVGWRSEIGRSLDTKGDGREERETKKKVIGRRLEIEGKRCWERKENGENRRWEMKMVRKVKIRID